MTNPTPTDREAVAPERIWATPDSMNVTRDCGEWDRFDSDNPKAVEYIRRDHAEAEKQAAVKAAIEAAELTLDTHGDGAVNRALGQRLCCSGQMCGCQGADVGSFLQHLIRHLPAPTDALDRAIEAAAERAFKDGITYATICDVSDPDEAWRTSACRAAIRARSDKGVA